MQHVHLPRLRQRRARFLLLALCLLAALLVLGALLLAGHPPSQEASPADELRVEARARANGTDALVVTFHAANAGALVHYRVEDPREAVGAPARALASWNATEGATQELTLQSLPRLLVVTALPAQSEAVIYQKWVWHGRANLLVADTPHELARMLHAAPEEASR